MVRSTTRATAGWVFGLAATILFISVWGRAIVVDTDGLAEAAAPLAGSATVVGLFADWLGEELEDNGVDPSLAAPAVDYVLETTEVGSAIDEFVREVVAAASLPGSEAASVDIAGLLTPVVPEITDTLAAAGVPVDNADVANAVAGLEPLTVRRASASPYVGVNSPIANRLGTAAVLALLVMVMTGWVAVVVSRDRMLEARRLLSRLALGGLSFGILLRIGSWVLDPVGGRAPIPESLSLLVGSKWMVPISIASVSAVLAVTIWGVRRLARRREGSPMQDERSTQEQEPHLSLQG